MKSSKSSFKPPIMDRMYTSLQNIYLTLTETTQHHTYQVRKYETGIYVQKRHSDWTTMLRIILLEVLAIASDTFLPSFRQSVDARL